MQKHSNQQAGLIYMQGVNDRFIAGVMIDEGAGVTREQEGKSVERAANKLKKAKQQKKYPLKKKKNQDFMA